MKITYTTSRDATVKLSAGYQLASPQTGPGQQLVAFTVMNRLFQAVGRCMACTKGAVMGTANILGRQHDR